LTLRVWSSMRTVSLRREQRTRSHGDSIDRDACAGLLACRSGRRNLFGSLTSPGAVVVSAPASVVDDRERGCGEVSVGIGREERFGARWELCRDERARSVEHAQEDRAARPLAVVRRTAVEREAMMDRDVARLEGQ